MSLEGKDFDAYKYRERFSGPDKNIGPYTPEVPVSDPLWKDKSFVLSAIQKDCRAVKFASSELQNDEDVLLKIIERLISKDVNLEEVHAGGYLLPAGWENSSQRMKEFIKKHEREVGETTYLFATNESLI